MVPADYRGPVIGLDVSAGAVRLVEVKRSKEGPRITAFAQVMLDEGSVDGGIVMRTDIVSEAISTAFKLARLKARKASVVTALAPSQVFIRQIRVPKMNEDELSSALQWEAERYIPFDPAEAVMSFHYPPHPDSGQESEIDVILIAAKAQVANAYLDVLELAGVRPRVLEVSLFALPWVCRYLPPEEGEALEELERRMEYQGLVELGAAYLEVSPDQSGLLVMCGDDYRLSRSIPIGTAKLVQQHEDMSGRHPGLDGASCEALALEMRRNLDYYSKVIKGLTSRVYVCGDGAALPGLVDALEREIEIPVEVMKPLKGLSVDLSKVDKAEMEEAGAAMSVAVGLALRGLNQLG